MSKREDRDYPEDFDKENGLYLCVCSTCGREFTGHKRRRTCKLCKINENLIMIDKANNCYQPTNMFKWKRVFKKFGEDLKETKVLMQQFTNSDYQIRWEEISIEDEEFFN